MAESCQCIHFRHQCGNSGSFAGILAVRAVRGDLDHVEVCFAGERCHIWNPSNFGISVLLFLAAETVASLSIQWGNYLLPMLVIWVLGSVIIWRLNRFHIMGIYVLSFLAFRFSCAAG